MTDVVADNLNEMWKQSNNQEAPESAPQVIAFYQQNKPTEFDMMMLIAVMLDRICGLKPNRND